VMGCAAATAPEALAMLPGVAAVIPPSQREQALRVVGQLLGARTTRRPAGAEQALPGRARPFVKVQDGCEYRCSFCIVPQARGRERSRPLSEVLAEINGLVAAGAREIVLTGIRLGAYGRELGLGLADLVRTTGECGPARVRLSSIEPWDVTDDLLEALGDHPRWCPHLHLPLQSGADDVLRMMGRGHTADDFRRLVDRFRARLPAVALSTDVLVGFPGEEEQHFQQTRRLINQIGFARLHVFSYSRRPGTSAAELPEQVPAAVKDWRSRELLALGRDLECRFAQRSVGAEVEVLFETAEPESGTVEGVSEHYLRVVAPGGPQACGRLTRVLVMSAEGAILRGVREGCAPGLRNHIPVERPLMAAEEV
jgi:threonylcarbamoyladenosine tRNA methylthiotransferase MtaB